jgi:hypothetical protein
MVRRILFILALPLAAILAFSTAASATSTTVNVGRKLDLARIS